MYCMGGMPAEGYIMCCGCWGMGGKPCGMGDVEEGGDERLPPVLLLPPSPLAPKPLPWPPWGVEGVEEGALGGPFEEEDEEE